MKRHYPYRYKEKCYFEPPHRAGAVIDSLWTEYKQEQHLAEGYMRRKSGEIPWVDPSNFKAGNF